MANEDKGERRSPADIVIRAGAVAAALASIAGLVALVWPDSPARLAAEFGDVDVRADVGLTEFSARQERAEPGTPAEAPKGGRLSPRLVLLASHTAGATSLAQAPEGDQGSPPDAGPPPGPDTTPAPEPDTTEPSPELEMRPGPRPTLPPEIEILDDVKEQLPLEELPGCRYQIGKSTGKPQVLCAQPQGLQFLAQPNSEDAPASGGAVVDAKDLLNALRGTRARPASGGRTEPLGVTINFILTLEGFKGKRADVRWSLYDAGARRRVPRDWLANRRALSARAEAASDRAGGEFWVPLPRRRGPFFVRLSVYDEDGTQLDRADSRPFR